MLLVALHTSDHEWIQPKQFSADAWLLTRTSEAVSERPPLQKAGRRTEEPGNMCLGAVGGRRREAARSSERDHTDTRMHGDVGESKCGKVRRKHKL